MCVLADVPSTSKTPPRLTEGLRTWLSLFSMPYHAVTCTEHLQKHHEICQPCSRSTPSADTRTPRAPLPLPSIHAGSNIQTLIKGHRHSVSCTPSYFLPSHHNPLQHKHHATPLQERTKDVTTKEYSPTPPIPGCQPRPSSRALRVQPRTRQTGLSLPSRGIHPFSPRPTSPGPGSRDDASHERDHRQARLARRRLGRRYC